MSELNPVRRQFIRLEAHFEQVDPTLPPAVPAPLNIVRRKLIRLEGQFERVDLSMPPAVAAPLDIVRGPCVVIDGQFERVTGLDLVLTLDGTADVGVVFDRVCDLITELDRYARASGGSGLTLDTRRSTAVPGTVTLRLVPADPARGPQQAEVAKAEIGRIPGVAGVQVIAA